MNLIVSISWISAGCVEESEIPVGAAGGRMQRYTEECNVCCGSNLLDVEIDEENFVGIHVDFEG
jgi:hypothetical protein